MRCTIKLYGVVCLQTCKLFDSNKHETGLLFDIRLLKRKHLEEYLFVTMNEFNSTVIYNHRYTT